MRREPAMTRILPPTTVVAIALAATAIAAPAQAPVYRAPRDTVYIALVNPYHMFWVRGADTLGSPLTDISVERQLWRSDGGRLVVRADQRTLNVSRHVAVDTMTVAPNGRLLLVGGKPPGPTGRVDFLLRLPDRPLTPGATWSDTLDTAADSSMKRYRVERSYRVVGPVDSLGRHLVRVEAEGTVRYRDGWWADSARGLRIGIDVSGPVHESFLFDPAAGQLVGRSWKMELRGRGTVPRDSRSLDTLPAGLDAREDHVQLTADAARLASRELPGADTSVTSSEGSAILLHTVRRSRDSVESALARNDGLVGVARARFSNGVPESYAAEWTQGIEPPKERRVTHVGDSLRVGGEGRDTTVAIPAASWGIADYAMEESLAPVLLALAQAGDTAARPFAIYRPYARHWDIGQIQLRHLAGGVVAYILLGDAVKPAVMLLSEDGDYLYGYNAAPKGAERAPKPGTARRAKVEAMLAQRS